MGLKLLDFLSGRVITYLASMTTPPMLQGPNKTTLGSFYHPLVDRIDNFRKVPWLNALAFPCEADCMSRPDSSGVHNSTGADCR